MKNNANHEDNSVNLEYIKNIGTKLDNLTELKSESSIQYSYDGFDDIYQQNSMTEEKWNNKSSFNSISYQFNTSDISLENVLNNILVDLNSPYSTLNINSIQIDYFDRIVHANMFSQFSINEKFLLKELILAGVFLQNPYQEKVFISSNNQFHHQCPIVDSTLYRLICLCKHLTPFISLQLNDQIQLLKYGLIEMLSVMAIQNYNPEMKAWSFIDVKTVFLINLILILIFFSSLQLGPM